MGKYIEPTSTYLSLTRKSIYSNQVKLGFETEEEPLQYVVVYPFIKSREWYLLPFEKRKEMMEEHIRVGRKYPEIRLNTTYSFGIGDQDFMLAFETDNLSKFQNLIIDLRETQVSRYIIKGYTNDSMCFKEYGGNNKEPGIINIYFSFKLKIVIKTFTLYLIYCYLCLYPSIFFNNGFNALERFNSYGFSGRIRGLDF